MEKQTAVMMMALTLKIALICKVAMLPIGQLMFQS
jgi:hypothetical protein